MVFKGIFLLGILLAVGRASEDYQKCIDNCTQTLEDKVTEELENCKGKCQGIIGPVTHSFGLQSMLNDIFRQVDDSHRHGGLTLSFGALPTENEEWGMPKWVHQHVGNMMHQMNQQMGQMMQSMKTGMNDMMTSGGGKMHVMKSGPGFYEEKTYDIGPNGEMTLIQNDEMDKANELENNDVDEQDVEVFDPNMLMREFEQVVHDATTNNEKEEKGWIQEMDKQLAKQIINDLNDIEEGPKLPETGLRSRLDNDRCRMEGLQWSEWSKCLHLNMAMPKWLVISSLSLGILFLIWLCLVIPSNAPKQRVKKQATNNAKEVEAFTIITEEKKLPPVYQPTNDLPPPYEDVANVKVALEPENTTKNNEV